MEFVILLPVESALDEIKAGGSKESIFYNYYSHCLALARGEADEMEKQLLPQLNQAIEERWNEATLKRIKKRAWDVVQGKASLESVAGKL